MAACVEEYDPTGESGPWGRCLRLAKSEALVAQRVKNLSAMQETQVPFLDQEDPLDIPVFLPGEFHGQRNLVGYTVHGVTKSWR